MKTDIPTTTSSDTSVSIGHSLIKSVKTDNVKHEITFQVSIPLNGDNFIAANRLAFFAFNEDSVKIDVVAMQKSFGELLK